ncbi:unnamed protein product [Coccothraustes coccothraustes]
METAGTPSANLARFFPRADEDPPAPRAPRLAPQPPPPRRRPPRENAGKPRASRRGRPAGKRHAERRRGVRREPADRAAAAGRRSYAATGFVRPPPYQAARRTARRGSCLGARGRW